MIDLVVQIGALQTSKDIAGMISYRQKPIHASAHLENIALPEVLSSSDQSTLMRQIWPLWYIQHRDISSKGLSRRKDSLKLHYCPSIVDARLLSVYLWQIDFRPRAHVEEINFLLRQSGRHICKKSNEIEWQLKKQILHEHIFRTKASLTSATGCDCARSRL